MLVVLCCLDGDDGPFGASVRGLERVFSPGSISSRCMSRIQLSILTLPGPGVTLGCDILSQLLLTATPPPPGPLDPLPRIFTSSCCFHSQAKTLLEKESR